MVKAHRNSQQGWKGPPLAVPMPTSLALHAAAMLLAAMSLLVHASSLHQGVIRSGKLLSGPTGITTQQGPWQGHSSHASHASHASPASHASHASHGRMLQQGCQPAVFDPPSGDWNVSQAGAEANATLPGSCGDIVVPLPTSYTDSCDSTKTIKQVEVQNATQTAFVTATPTPVNVSLACGRTTVKLTDQDDNSFYQTYDVADNITITMPENTTQVLPCLGGTVQLPSYASACNTTLNQTVIMGNMTLETVSGAAGDIMAGNEITIANLTCNANHTLSSYVTGCDGVRTYGSNITLMVSCALYDAIADGWTTSQAGAEANATILSSCSVPAVPLPTNYTDSCNSTKPFTQVEVQDATQTTFVAVTPTPTNVSLACGRTTVKLTDQDGASYYKSFHVPDKITVVKPDPQTISCSYLGAAVRVPTFTSACRTTLLRTLYMGSKTYQDLPKTPIGTDFRPFIPKDLACGATHTLTVSVTGCDGVQVNTSVPVIVSICDVDKIPEVRDTWRPRPSDAKFSGGKGTVTLNCFPRLQCAGVCTEYQCDTSTGNWTRSVLGSCTSMEYLYWQKRYQECMSQSHPQCSDSLGKSIAPLRCDEYCRQWA